MPKWTSVMNSYLPMSIKKLPPFETHSNNDLTEKQYKITIIIIPAMYRPHLFILIYKRMVRLSSPLFMRWDYIG